MAAARPLTNEIPQLSMRREANALREADIHIPDVRSRGPTYPDDAQQAVSGGSALIDRSIEISHYSSFARDRC